MSQWCSRFGWCRRLALAMIVGFGLTAGVQAAERPNIILCMADDQGWGSGATRFPTATMRGFFAFVAIRPKPTKRSLDVKTRP